MVNYKVTFNDFAQSEYIKAYQDYEQKLEGLGLSLEVETDKIVKHISDNPFLFQRKFKHYREAPLKKFPFLIVYELIGKEVVVNSFFNTNRDHKVKLKK